MNKTKALLTTATMVLMLGCSGPSFSQTRTENPQFLKSSGATKFLERSESVLGLNEVELIKVLGAPKEIEETDCVSPSEPVEDQTVPTFWLYENLSATTWASLSVCVVNNHAVAEVKTVGILMGTRIFSTSRTLLDTDLIEKAFRNELDKSSYEERTTPTPQFPEPEYEI